MAAWIPLVGTIIDKVLGVVDKAVPDKDLREKLKAELQRESWNTVLQESSVRKEIIVSEATGHSWLQRNWRPILMLMFAYMIFHNFVLVPVIQAFYPTFPTVAVPDNVWNILALGVGGYILGRSGEKMIALWRNKNA